MWWLVHGRDGPYPRRVGLGSSPANGDLRTPNIMVVPDGSGSDTRCRGVLLDFDWVGTHGIGRFPASLDNGLDWASGIKRYGIMDKAHDIAKFEDQCRSVQLV
jgi:hypothetical protein